MGVIEDIRARLEAGVQPRDLVAERYSSNSVYAARRRLKQRPEASYRQHGGRRPVAGTSRPNDAQPSVGASLHQDRQDPEVLELHRDLAKSKLASPSTTRIRLTAETIDLPSEVFIYYDRVRELYPDHTDTKGEWLYQVVKTWVYDHAHFLQLDHIGVRRELKEHPH